MTIKVQHGEYVIIGIDHLAMRGSDGSQWHLSRMVPDGLDILLVAVHGYSSVLFDHLSEATEEVERVIEKEYRERMKEAQADRERAARAMDSDERECGCSNPHCQV